MERNERNLQVLTHKAKALKKHPKSNLSDFRVQI
nr:MAG TPA: hypothetical protein [Caudoviricetes sp.]